MSELQPQIIEQLGVQPEIDPATELEARSQFLADYLRESGLAGYLIAVSGGQDSLLAGLLAKRATEKLQQEGCTASLHAALLPYGVQADRDDAELACELIAPDILHDLNIQSSTDTLNRTFEDQEGEPLSDFDKGNVKARMRMVAQYALASRHELLVIGSDHAAEAVTGFFTKFGDGAADITPLTGLTKRQGKQMLESLDIPNQLTGKKPTADLLDNKPGQTDEAELGITYRDIDDYLEGSNIDPVVASALEKRYQITAHKRDVPVAYGQ